jgi:hypothetical protein
MTVQTLGGRKNVIVMVAMGLLACKNLLGIDDATVQQIVTLAIGGAGVIAAEKAGTAIATRKRHAKSDIESVPPPPQ